MIQVQHNNRDFMWCMLIFATLAALIFFCGWVGWKMAGDQDRDKATYNACRDKGGSVSWCAFGLK